MYIGSEIQRAYSPGCVGRVGRVVSDPKAILWVGTSATTIVYCYLLQFDDHQNLIPDFVLCQVDLITSCLWDTKGLLKTAT